MVVTAKLSNFLAVSAMTRGDCFPTIFQLRTLFRTWGPYVGAGIRVKVDSDLRWAVSTVKQTWYNRTFVGAHYGGTLFSMTDPFYMLMLMNKMGPDYIVWDRAASIEFVKPGRGEVVARFELTEEKIREIVEGTSSGQPHFAQFKVDVVDLDGGIIARVDKTVYVRKKPEYR